MESCEKFELELYKNRAWIHADIPDSKGLQRISFIMDAAEFTAFCSMKPYFMAADGYYKLDTFGSLCTFFNMEMPRATSGKVEVPFVRIEINQHARKKMLKLARAVWNKTETNPDFRKIFTFSQATRNRWQRDFSVGTGKVDYIFSNPEVKAGFESNHNNTSFNHCVNVLSNCAKNTTQNRKETAKISISKDGDYGYYFTIYNPNNHITMNGGLLWSNSCNDWSIHT